VYPSRGLKPLSPANLRKAGTVSSHALAPGVGKPVDEFNPLLGTGDLVSRLPLSFRLALRVFARAGDGTPALFERPARD
jgi:hypothetical protein